MNCFIFFNIASALVGPVTFLGVRSALLLKN